MTDPKLNRRAALAAVLMGTAALTGQALVPTRRLADLRHNFSLEALVPEAFGNWRNNRQIAANVVNAQTQELVSKLYSQVLSRVYETPEGRPIMLSIAYGDDQSNPGVQLHYPEVCYPAQGFKVNSMKDDTVQTAQGAIKVRRLETEFAKVRLEPVTYWTIIGDMQSREGWERKKAEIRHSLQGNIVDGLLFRVSCIDSNSAQGFAWQDRFITDVVAAMNGEARRQLVGLA